MQVGTLKNMFPCSRACRLIVISTVFAIMSMIFYQGELKAVIKKKHVILLGASIGHDWKIESLPERLNGAAQRYSFEYVGEYQYNKSQSLRDILNRKQMRPDAVILKECATYFPGNFAEYQELMKYWIRDCKKAGVIPIPATVLPVLKQNSLTSRVKDVLKLVLGRPPASAQLKQINQYNDWIKSYATCESLTVLDLEEPVRISPNDRSLRIDFQSGDGLHLNRAAYDRLDKTLITALDHVFYSTAPRKIHKRR